MTQKTVLRIAAIISGLSGVIILIGVMYPILSYDSVYGKNFSELVSPLSDDNGAVPSGFQQVKNNTTQSLSDFTQASNWFVGGAKSIDFGSSKVQFFNLSIPKKLMANI